MIVRRLFPLLALSLCFSAHAVGCGNGDAVIDLSTLLPPPPIAGSPEAQQDLQAVLTMQAARTSQESAAAKADSVRSVFRFDEVLGSAFQSSSLPRTTAFFARVAKFDKTAVKQAKTYWHRPRPSSISVDVHPLAKEKTDDWSYPSGHATFGYTAAILLANMIQEKRTAIFARADLYARHRIVMGVHFPSDVEAGRLAGTVIAFKLLQDPAWRDDYTAARTELRKVLALPAEATTVGTASLP